MQKPAVSRTLTGPANAVAEQAFDVAKRSWKYSPGLFKRTFQKLRTMLIGGAEKGASTR